MSLKNIPKNLLSKYNSKLYLNRINEIINTTLLDPPKIPVVINGKKIYNESIAQASPYLNDKIPCYYSYANKNNLNEYFNKYNDHKEIWNKLVVKINRIYFLERLIY